MYSTEYSEKESVSDRRSVTLSESVLPRNPHSCKETRRIPGRKQQKIQFPRQNNLRYDDWDFLETFFCGSEAGDCSLDTGSADGHDQNLQWKYKLKDTKPMCTNSV